MAFDSFLNVKNFFSGSEHATHKSLPTSMPIADLTKNFPDPFHSSLHFRTESAIISAVTRSCFLSEFTPETSAVPTPLRSYFRPRGIGLAGASFTEANGERSPFLVYLKNRNLQGLESEFVLYKWTPNSKGSGKCSLFSCS